MLTNVMSVATSLVAERKAITAVEYAIMGALISVALIAAIGLFTPALTAAIGTIQTQLTTAAG